MIRKRNILTETLLAVSFLSLTFGQLEAQIQPASSQTEFYFAHVTDGGSPSDKWTTQFRVVNWNPFPATGTLQFFSQSGGPLVLDFGGGAGTFFTVTVPAFGSTRLETRATSPVLNIGFVRAIFDAPVQATAEFRWWRDGVVSQAASVDGIAPNRRFLTFADAFTGIAVANPNTVSVLCTAEFVSSDGFLISRTPPTLSLPPVTQRAFTLGPFLSLPASAVGSYLIRCSEPVVSLAIAGNDRGITSSLPSGAFAFPANPEASIRRIFKHLVKTLNNTPDGSLAVGQPELLIGTGLILNAVAEPRRNRVTIWLAVAELLSDSPSELAYVIAHELGHIFQASRGLKFHPSNYELDADLFAIVAAFWADYDAYAAAGALGKLAMVTKNASINAQRFDDLFDPHTSFTNRIIQMFGLIEGICSRPDWDSFCTETRSIFHPHMPTPLRDSEAKAQ